MARCRCIELMYFFFFSSRRRHTRFDCDWSSDVCSSDLYVAERVLDAACALDWPEGRFEVQALDDSDDETVEIVARRLAHWRRQGILVSHVRRGSRAGLDRKSTRLNSSHSQISYAVFCLKKKKT